MSGDRELPGKVELTSLGDVSVVRLSGVIDERFSAGFEALAKLGGSVVIDLETITRITSYGVRDWIRTLDAMAADYYCFVRCPPGIVAQFNMVRNFGRRGDLVSLYLPFVCTRCGNAVSTLVNLTTQPPRALQTMAEGSMRCTSCGGDAEFDDVPDAYLSYVLSRPQPQPPRAVMEALGTLFRAQKEVVGDLTVITLGGVLDGHDAVRRVVDGLSGRLLLVMNEVRSVSAIGWQALDALFALPRADAVIARLDVDVALTLLDLQPRFPHVVIGSVCVTIRCARCGRERVIEADEQMLRGLVRRQREFACAGCGAPARPEASDRALKLPWDQLDADMIRHLASRGEFGESITMFAPSDTGRPAAPPPKQTPSQPPRGRYEILRTLGYGGMGTVSLARRVGAGGFERLLAIKKMHPHLAEDPQCVAMFLDEARLAARIHHPNVVGVLDVEEGAEGVRIVMDYIEGVPAMSFVEEIRARRAIDWTILLRVLVDALAGLHAAHELCDREGKPMNIVHRDVNPQNLLVGVDGVSRVADFGIAHATRRLASTTETGRIKGTLGYIATEQLNGEDVDRRADIYAMGVVACDFFLEPDPESSRGLLPAVRKLDEALLSARSAAPDEIRAACLPAVSLDRAGRYPTARAFVEALESAAAAARKAPAPHRTVGELAASIAHRKPAATLTR